MADGFTAGANTISAWIIIERPILDVFEYVFDARRLLEWVPVYSDVGNPTFDEAAKRWTVEVQLGMPPMTVRDTVTCLDVVAGRSITFQNRTFGQTATYLFEPTSIGTKVTALHTPWGFAAVSPFYSFVRPWSEHLLMEILLQLKQRLEALR